jgi:hypothetical protein
MNEHSVAKALELQEKVEKLEEINRKLKLEVTHKKEENLRLNVSKYNNTIG